MDARLVLSAQSLIAKGSRSPLVECEGGLVDRLRFDTPSPRGGLTSFEKAGKGSAPARWRSGYAEDCKSLHAGSIPARASTSQKMAENREKIRVGYLFLQVIYFVRVNQMLEGVGREMRLVGSSRIGRDLSVIRPAAYGFDLTLGCAGLR